MKQPLLRVIAASAAALTLACSTSSRRVEVESTGDVARSTDDPASMIIASWPMNPKSAATTLIGKYGQPALAGERMLVWYDKGPYAKIVLMRDEQPHSFPAPHTDYLSETVKYRIPLDKLDELAMYDGSVWFHRTRGELTAQCDKEELNNLALNLAVDVATGARTVEDARGFYGKTATAFKNGDRSSPYLTGLRFQTSASSADADKPQM